MIATACTCYLLLCDITIIPLNNKNTVKRDCSKFANLTISDFRVQHCREWNRCSLVCVAGGLSGSCS